MQNMKSSNIWRAIKWFWLCNTCTLMLVTKWTHLDLTDYFKIDIWHKRWLIAVDIYCELAERSGFFPFYSDYMCKLWIFFKILSRSMFHHNTCQCVWQNLPQWSTCTSEATLQQLIELIFIIIHHLISNMFLKPISRGYLLKGLLISLVLMVLARQHKM